MVQDISNVGKGNISKVTYVIKNSEGIKTFEEEFIGLDEGEIKKLFEVRKFFTASSNYEILRIENIIPRSGKYLLIKNISLTH